MATVACRKIVEGLLGAMGGSDASGMGDLLADDVQWWFPQSGAESSSVERLVQGRAAVLDILSHADRYFRRLQYEIDHLLEDGEMVAVHARASGETLIGRSYANEYMFLLRLRDGRVVEGWEFLDTAYAYSRNRPE